MMEFAHPGFLWLLLVVPLLWLGQRGSLADMTGLQRALCFAMRVVILLMLIGALAGVRLRLPSRDVAVLFAVDQSASISPAARQAAVDFVGAAVKKQGSNDDAGVVGFSKDAEVWQPPGTALQLIEWPVFKDRTASDFERAFEFTSAIFPTEKKRRLVLLSDGNDTSDRATAAAQALANAGVELFTVPLRNAAAPEVLVESVAIPQRLKAGEPFDLSANIRSNVETTAKVKLYQNQFLIEQRDVTLKVGDNDFRKASLQADGNFISYEVEVVPAQDTAMENNRAQATASLRGQPRVLIVDGDESKIRPLAEALRREKMQVETRGALGLPKTLEDLQQFDLLALSDVSALQMGREQMELFRRWVQDFGGGFLMVGGENSFGVGGYFRTPVEQMLPVRMEHEDRLDTPSVALLVVLDRSGSMTAQVQGQTKMSLANQGAVLALNVLQPKDYFGVLAVDVRSHTVVPLAQHATKSGEEQKILSVTAGGGGIYVYTSLVEAFGQLRDIPARIKHIILFSDAADAEEKNGGEMGDGARGGGSSLDLASAMLASKITTSVVALGLEADKDTAFLRQLAERGNGRFYLTSDATTLPQIFSTETMKVAQSSLVEEPFLAVPAMKSPLTAGLDWAQSPLLLGYNATKPKPTADILLATERGEPLLATWRYGLGQAAAFTSDAKSRWAAEWLQWPGFGKFWAQTVRGLMRKSDQASFEVQSRESGDDLLLTIDAVKPDGSFRNQLPITINALGPGGETKTLTAEQSSPGQYRAKLALAPEGTTIISVNSPELPDGGYTFGHTRSYPREFLSTETNETLMRSLAEMTGGKFAPTPAEIFARPEVAAPQRRDITDWLLMAALSLIPLDIWMRRRQWSRPATR